MIDLKIIIVFVIVGFIAQLIDGSIGMAYGVCALTCLTFLGVPVGVASASIHAAEVFTTFVSGLFHYKMKNIDWKVFWHLLLPGVIGGILGVKIMSIINSDILSKMINSYLIIMGVIILLQIKNKLKKRNYNRAQVHAIAFFGGLSDSFGGGWGPVVTSSMIISGYTSKKIIGSVNATEFFIALIQTIMFSSFIGIDKYIHIIVGLGVGGMIAAPVASIVCKKISEKTLLIIVGIMVVVLGVLNFFKKGLIN